MPVTLAEVILPKSFHAFRAQLSINKRKPSFTVSSCEDAIKGRKSDLNEWERRMTSKDTRKLLAVGNFRLCFFNEVDKLWATVCKLFMQH